MTPIRNLLSDAVRYGLAVGAVGIAGLASTSAFAQDTTTPAPDATKAKNLDRVEVIGSRIKRAVDTEPTQPVTTLTRADIQQTGLTSTYDIINHISASDGSGLSTVTTQTNGSDGSQTISLRNIGAQRTLILVDGKRWPTQINGVVDVSSIPVAIIERIEVLKDGASAIYGSDAIAGVVNIITRKKYDGAQAGWTYGQTTKGDGEQNSEDVTIGANGEHSNVVVALSRSQQGVIFAKNRTQTDSSIAVCDQLYSNFPDSDPNGYTGFCGSSQPAFGRFRAPGMGPQTLNNSFDEPGAWNTQFPELAHATRAGTKPSDFHPFGPLDRYNFAPVNFLQQPATRNNIYASGRFDITDNVSAYARASYTKRQSEQQLAQVPEGMGVASFGPQWGFAPTADNVFNPFGVDLTQARFRSVAVGPRANFYDDNTIGATAGVQGSFSLGDHSFDWDVFAQYNSNRESKIGEHYINLFHLKQAVGPSFRDAGGVLRCGTPAAIIAGCVPYNVFGGPDLGVGFGVITPAEQKAMIDYVSYTESSQVGNNGINFGANFSGELAQLQGGQLSFAAGVESRKQTGFNTPDALAAGGGSSDNAVQPTHGSTKVEEEYLEIDAPLLKDVAFAKELEFDAAVRHSAYTANGIGIDPLTLNPIDINVKPGAPTNAKFSLRWKPFNDLLLRASYGDTFRAPSVSDLFAGNAENFPSGIDPCDANNIPTSGPVLAECLREGIPATGVPPTGSAQIHATSGGNPFLKPEHGHNFTYGFVYSPSYINGLNLTVDYWRISLKDVIGALDSATVLDGCYSGQHPEYCPEGALAYIKRDPTTLELANVQTTLINQNSLMTDGVDVGLTYKYATSNWGNFGIKWDTTYNIHEKFTNGDVTSELLGVYAGAPNWRVRSVATLDWARGDWDASWTVRYMSAMQEAGGCTNSSVYFPLVCNHPNDRATNPFVAQDADLTGFTNGLGYNHVGAVTYHDVQVGWKAPWKAHLSIGARNVFGKEPPLVNTTFAQSFDASYDLPGGAFYYFQYRQDF